MDRDKEVFIEKWRQVATDLVYLVGNLSILADKWDDEFKAGKDSEITEEEANQKGVTLSDLANMKLFASGVIKFWTNQATTQYEYGKVARAMMSGYR